MRLAIQTWLHHRTFTSLIYYLDLYFSRIFKLVRVRAQFYFVRVHYLFIYLFVYLIDVYI